MGSTNANFELEYKDQKIRVQRHELSGEIIYRVLFADRRPALVLTRMLHSPTVHWWTSIPEGRQPEAEEIGPLIELYYQSNS